MFRAVCVLLLVLSAVLAFAQPPEIEWSRVYGVENWYVAEDVAVCADNGYIVAGRAHDPWGGVDGMAVRMDSDGDTLWSLLLGTDGDEQWNSVYAMSDGDFVLAGFTYATGAG